MRPSKDVDDIVVLTIATVFCACLLGDYRPGSEKSYLGGVILRVTQLVSSLYPCH